jgi:hypothetical protein
MSLNRTYDMSTAIRALQSQVGQLFTLARTTGFPYTNPLVDNTQVGGFWVCLTRTVNTTDTTIVHELGATPAGFIVIGSANGHTLYNGSAGPAAWTPSTIVLRSMGASDTYSFLIL